MKLNLVEKMIGNKETRTILPQAIPHTTIFLLAIVTQIQEFVG